MTWRRGSQVTPDQEQWEVEAFHEESEGGVASVMASRRERRARYSEMGAERVKWKRKRRSRRRIFASWFWVWKKEAEEEEEEHCKY